MNIIFPRNLCLVSIKVKPVQKLVPALFFFFSSFSSSPSLPFTQMEQQFWSTADIQSRALAMTPQDPHEAEVAVLKIDYICSCLVCVFGYAVYLDFCSAGIW